jgi:hypothetical protein
LIYPGFVKAFDLSSTNNGSIAMSHILKSYSSAYVLEQTKLNRIAAVLEERFASSCEELKREYEIRHLDSTVINVDSVDRIYEFHNSGKKSIASLIIRVTSKSRIASLEFTTVRGSGEVTLLVGDEDPRWAADTFAAVEEQVERCLKGDAMYKTGNLFRGALIPLIFIPIMIGIIFTMLSDPSRNLSLKMWLTRGDIQQIAGEIDDSSKSLQEKQLGILKRQVQNLKDSLDQRPPKITWPIGFIVFPMLLVIICFLYLVKECYPQAVFLWGDAEEWYQTIIKRRNFVWTTILASTAVSIISGLFLMGIDSYLR